MINADQASRMRADLKAETTVSVAMLLAAAALNGVVLFAFTRVHGLTVGAHAILLLWLVCLLPLACGTRAKALSAAASALFVAWFIAVTFRDLSIFATLDRALLIAPLLVLGGVTAFSPGGLHYFVPGFDNVARPARIVGLQAVVLGLFAMTIERVAGGTKLFNQLRDLDASTQVTVSCVCAAIVTIGATIGAQAFRERAPRLTVIEAPVNVVLVLTAIAFVLVPIPGDTAATMASVVFVLLVGSVMAFDSAAGDGRLVRTAGFSGVFFVAFKLAFFLVERDRGTLRSAHPGASDRRGPGWIGSCRLARRRRRRQRFEVLRALDPAQVQRYQPYWVAMSYLMEMRNECREAARSLERALGLTTHPRLRHYLTQRLAAMQRRTE